MGKSSGQLVFDSLETGPIMTNTYIVGDAQKKVAMVVDPGGHVGAIRSCLERHGLACQWILNTHAHFDHVGGNQGLKAATGAELMIHELEADWLTQLGPQARLFGMSAENSPKADRTLKEGDELEVGGLRLQILHTPGHSPGSISVVIVDQKKILVGDLVFAGSIGRTDLPGGSFEELVSNVHHKIFKFPDDTKLYPGHGPETTIGVERRTNPFLTGAL